MGRTSAACRVGILTASIAAVVGPVVGCEVEGEEKAGSDQIGAGGTAGHAGKGCQSSWYGPAICDADIHCEQAYGKGAYCDEDNWFHDNCGSVNWPVCKVHPSTADAADQSAPDVGTHDADAGAVEADASCDEGSIDCGTPDLPDANDASNLDDS